MVYALFIECLFKIYVTSWKEKPVIVLSVLWHPYPWADQFLRENALFGIMILTDALHWLGSKSSHSDGEIYQSYGVQEADTERERTRLPTSHSKCWLEASLIWLDHCSLGLAHLTESITLLTKPSHTLHLGTFKIHIARDVRFKVQMHLFQCLSPSQPKAACFCSLREGAFQSPLLHKAFSESFTCKPVLIF